MIDGVDNPIASRPVGDSRYVSVEVLNESSDSESERVEGAVGITQDKGGRLSPRPGRMVSSQPDLRWMGKGGVGACDVLRDIKPGNDCMKVSSPPGRRNMVERNHLPSDLLLCESCCT